MLCTVLQPKNTTRNAFLPADAKGVPDPSVIGTMLRRASPPAFIGSWPYEGTQIHLYGYKTGKAGTENKHELPPPHDAVLLFGEAVLVATTGSSPSRFNGEDYKKFYNTVMGGFDDVEEDDEEEEEEEEEEEDGAAEAEKEEDAEKEDEEEEEEVLEEVLEEVRAAPKRAAKPKKTSKKLPAFYSLPELEPEAYRI